MKKIIKCLNLMNILLIQDNISKLKFNKPLFLL